MRRTLELLLLDLIGQHEARGDWPWAAWWRDRWLALAQCPDAVLAGFARELTEVARAGLAAVTQ